MRRAGDPPRIGIVGGGISGLATAHFLATMLPEAQLTLYEAHQRLGGVIRTHWCEGFCFEGGPDAFLEHKPEARDLCLELGLGPELMPSRPEYRRSYVWSAGKLHVLPTLLNPPLRAAEIEATTVLSSAGKRRALAEPEVAVLERAEDEETVEDFFARRFGSELAARIIRPLVAGVFGGSASEISLQAAFPALSKWELERGCLLDAAPPSQSDRPSSAPVFLSLRQGMGQLVERLRESLAGRIGWKMAAEATRILPGEEGYLVEAKGIPPASFDHVVLCLPAPQGARLLSGRLGRIAPMLDGIPYAPAIMACLGFRQPLTNGMPGAGFLVGTEEKEHCLLACTWVDHKFSARCPPECSLVRCYLAGDQAHRRMAWDDDAITADVVADFQALNRLSECPDLVEVCKLPRALPQYRLGHQARIEALKAAADSEEGLWFVGNFIDGVGIPDCVRHADDTARSIADRVAKTLDE